ncbi:hypothetical protein CS345_00700 [Bordetella bronchiseptica]|nr:hypothetical protein CS345_00700 [Bordetella bronchiseptica]
MTVARYTEASASGLARHFDAVIILTDQPWREDPLDPRYVRARHFAGQLPVVVVEPGSVTPTGPLRMSGGIEVVAMTAQPTHEAVDRLTEALHEHSIRRPLFWLEDCRAYLELLDCWPNAMTVYRASGGGVAVGAGATVALREAATLFRQAMPRYVHLLVATDEHVAATYRRYGEYAGLIEVLADAYGSNFGQYLSVPQEAVPSRSVLYHGPIDDALDYELLHQLVHLLPDWKFVFCGAADDQLPAWRGLAAHGNVSHTPTPSAADFGAQCADAMAGILPFNMDARWTSRRRAAQALYEAAGLPVLDRAEGECQLQAQAWVAALHSSLAEGRAEAGADHKPGSSLLDAASHGAALGAMVEDAYLALLRRPLDHRLNVLVLYDDRWTHIGTVEEHLGAFQKYSRHNIFYLPVTRQSPEQDRRLAAEIDLSVFDVVIMHYAVRLSLKDYLPEPMALRIRRFTGLKVLFIQDEYDTTNTAKAWIKRLAFDIVYTCVPPAGREYVYPASDFHWTEFLSTLTGYVPEDPSLGQYLLPLREREILVAYRGRMLPYFYGSLGWQKYRIGVDVKALAQERGLPVDIEVDDTKRIYGTDWYRFLGSARATLGTESGSNVFDFDGNVRSEIERRLAQNPELPFAELYNELLEPLERNIRMNQISPKIFEAIRLRTALVLFEGEYSGALTPGVHYIALSQDYANIDEVFARLQDLDFLERMTERAYEDIVASGRYSYRSFVEGVDADIEQRWLCGPRARIYAAPVLATDRHGAAHVIMPSGTSGWCLSTSILSGTLQREQLAGHMSTAMGNWAQIMLAERKAARRAYLRAQPRRYAGAAYRRSIALARRVWHRIPMPAAFRRQVVRGVRAAKTRLMGR